jgi:hypothetical protein
MKPDLAVVKWPGDKVAVKSDDSVTTILLTHRNFITATYRRLKNNS